MEKLISVIIPVYNVEPFLDKCVHSVQMQTYQNIEIILVDDGSTDQCPEMCDKFAEVDSRVRVIHKINGGLSDARNMGIEHATGEYIMFLDSDDYINKETIERLYEAIKRYNVKMAICNFCCVDSIGNATGESLGSPIRDEVLEAKEILKRFYQSHGWFYIVAWNKLYHKSLLSKSTFPVGRIHEDEYTAAQLIWNAHKVACIQYSGYNYLREREGSIMQNAYGAKHLDAYFALIERYKFYQSIGCKELLYETQARIYEVLKEYYFNESNYGESYKDSIRLLCEQYDKLTGLPLKDRVRWNLLKMNPQLLKVISRIV